jgi:hypothetical protein
MRRIWGFAPWLPYEIELKRLVRHCEFINGMELTLARPPADQFAPANFPVAQLRLTLEEFDVDCFLFNSFSLVSARMRDVMALSPTAVEYLDVDASLSAPLPRSKGYKIMRVIAAEEAADVDKSVYSAGRVVGGPSSLKLATRIALRSDLEPASELFRDKFFRGYELCTDSLAVKLLQNHCTGVRFLDLDHLSIAEPKRFRTLRGVEEAGEWDPVSKIFHTTLIEAVH